MEEGGRALANSSVGSFLLQLVLRGQREREREGSITGRTRSADWLGRKVGLHKTNFKSLSRAHALSHTLSLTHTHSTQKGRNREGIKGKLFCNSLWPTRSNGEVRKRRREYLSLSRP